MNDINVCLACDDNYSKYAGVVIASILTNAKDDENLNIYILDGGISEENKSKIEQLKQIRNCYINFVEIDNSMFSEYLAVKTHSYITIAAYYRLNLSKLLPDVDRIIYLDCDIVVNSSLYELFNTEMNNNSFAGVIDINKKMVAKNPTHVNSGMLVMDLKNIRKHNLEDKFLEYAKSNVENITCGDQEIINEVCKGNITIVDEEWNVQVSDFMNRSSLTKTPKIIHYIAKNKPWNKITICYFKNYYIKYFQMTPWKFNKFNEFVYKYVDEFISVFKFMLHRPTFLFQKKFYRTVVKTFF